MGLAVRGIGARAIAAAVSVFGLWALGAAAQESAPAPTGSFGATAMARSEDRIFALCARADRTQALSEAIAACTRLVESLNDRSQKTQALWMRGQRLHESGAWAQGDVDLRAAAARLEMEANANRRASTRLRLGQVAIYTDLGDTQAALAIADVLAKDEPDDARVLVAQGFLRFRVGDFSGAETVFARAASVLLGRSDGETRTHALAGRCMAAAAQGDSANAGQAACAQALARAPGSAMAALAAAYLAFSRADLAGAQAGFEAALTADPDLAIARYARGSVKIARGDLAGGEADMAAAAKAHPRRIGFWAATKLARP